MKPILHLDWDAIAGIGAAVVALILHFLHVVDEGVLLSIVLALLALSFLRDLRREPRQERLAGMVERTESVVAGLERALRPPDSLLFGPRQLRVESERFSRAARGEMVWFNVCLVMFRPQSLFDALLRPAIENPLVTSIRFVLDEGEKERWREDVLPKVGSCPGRAKVREPRWCRMKESVSFILADVGAEGATEALLSFWGEPFMARATGKEVPRYIFRVQSHSDLVARLAELERGYRLAA